MRLTLLFWGVEVYHVLAEEDDGLCEFVAKEPLEEGHRLGVNDFIIGRPNVKNYGVRVRPRIRIPLSYFQKMVMIPGIKSADQIEWRVQQLKRLTLQLS